MIKLQGGNPELVKNTDLLPKASELVSVKADKSGYISSINAYELGMAALLLGAGRIKKTDKIDPAVGFWMKKHKGDYIEKDEDIAVFHVNSKSNIDEAVDRFKNAVIIKIY